MLRAGAHRDGGFAVDSASSVLVHSPFVSRRRITVVLLLLVMALCSGWNRFGAPVLTSRDGSPDCDAFPVIVHLVGESHELIMHEGRSGPMYTVKDKAGGVVERCAAEETLLRDHPDLFSPTLGVIRTLHTSQMGYVP